MIIRDAASADAARLAEIYAYYVHTHYFAYWRFGFAALIGIPVNHAH